MPTKNSGHGGDPLNFEGSLENSVCHAGARQDGYPFLPPISCWRTAGSAALSTTSGPDLVTLASTYLRVAKWDHPDDDTVALRTDGIIDEHWAQIQDDLILLIEARKVDSGADENSDLKISARLAIVQPGGIAAEQVAVTVTSSDLPPAGTAAATPFTVLSLDIGAALVSAGVHIKRGASFDLQIFPNETVGTTDMDLEVLSVKFRGRRHPAMYDRSLRL